ncbi:hypothetical protein [Streptomyces avermitilis]|uniref:hypothetical protein n=1 Tax=Streptomyces avermitilis TaxID=33903 RepID=UPI00381F62B7
MPGKQFTREADMLAPIANQASHLLQRRKIETLFEVQTTSGIPDIICIEFNKAALKRRAKNSQSFVTDFADMCVLRALNMRKGETVTGSMIATQVPLSSRYITSVVLPRLTEYGHAYKESRGRWRTDTSFTSLAKYVCTMEVKIRDWRGGYSQTLRHRTSADEAWLVLDSGHSAPAVAHQDWFSRAGIGLATLHSIDGIKNTVSPRPKSRSETINVYRELLIERAAHLYSNGEVSGAIEPVFGVDLTTTTGPDPRRPNDVERHPNQVAAHSTIS